MEKIKSHINNLKPNDDRVNELYYINQQNFSFTEDIHSGEFYKNKAKDLFYRDEADYFLREVWLPPDFNKNKTNISFYTNQLTQENSVVIIGINNKTKSKYNLEETDIALIFNDTKETNSWNISYSIHDLDNLNINNNKVKDSFELKYYPNKFISNCTSDYKIPEMEKQQHNGIYNPFNETDDLIKFYWLKDTSFKLPKVFVIFYFFHPFQRPNSTNDDDKDKMFYHLMLYLSYMQREAEFALADAIRAGNTFKLGYAENYIYIDIMSFSDVIENVLNIINERIIAVNNETIQKIQKDYEIYKDYAFEEYINFDNINVKEVLKHEYFKYISKINDEFPPIYNYYKLKKEKSENFEEINKDYISFLKMPILYTFIMGYCEENDIKKYYNIFSQGSNNPHFTMTLLLANLSTSLSGNEFVENSLTRNDLKENINIQNCTDLKDSKSSYSFMRFTKFSDYDRIPVEIFRRLIQENRTDFSVEIINQKSIYLRFFFPDNYTTENIKQRAMDIIKYIGDIISQPFDIFGGRYYYLVKNLENEYTKTPNDLKSAAVDFSFNQLYQRKRDDNSHKLNPEDYKNFTDTIEQFFNNNPNYIEFSYKENNI